MDDNEEEMIVPGNNRRMQKRRRPRRKLFGKARKERFLEAFSCNANCVAAAEIAGVTEGCVYTHRRKDAEFRDQYWAALEQATAKLAALRIQKEIERAEGRSADGLEVELDGPPDARAIADLYKLLHQLREAARGLSGPTGSGRARPGRPHDASAEEICQALAKRLKAFGMRCDPPARDASADGSAPPRDASADGSAPAREASADGSAGSAEGDSSEQPLHQPPPSAAAGPPPRAGEELKKDGDGHE